MNSSPPDPTAAAPRRLARRVAVIAVCLVAAFAAAMFSRHATVPVSQQPPPPQPPPLTADQVLATIPAPTGHSGSDRALALTLEKVRAKPADAVAWVNLGDALAQVLRDTAAEQYYAHAEAAYRFALRLNPRSVDAMCGMAWVTGGRHTFDQSKEWANQALALDAGNAAAFGIMGDAEVELGDYDAAFEHYQKMMDLKPDLSSWSRGAHLLWLTGDAKKAIWLMEKAIKAGAPFAENTAWCRANLAMMLFQQGALLPAEQTLEPALRADSRNTHLLLAAGRIAAARQDFPRAEKYFQTVLETSPNHDALVALGDLHAVRGEPAEAEKFYAQVVAADTQLSARAGHSHLALAKFYADHDRQLVEALRLAEERKLTRNVREADTLAWVYFKNGDQPHAIEAIKRALSQKTPDAEMHFHAGLIAAKAGNHISAQNHLQLALSLNPQFSILNAPLAARALDELGTAQSTAAAPAADGAPLGKH